MRELLIFTAACLAVGAGKTFNYISVKYDAGINGYWSLPKRVDEDSRFKYVESDKSLNVDLYSFPNDPRFFVLYDHYGTIAGVRIGYIKADLPKRAEKNGIQFEYRFDDKQIFDSGNYWNTDVWHSTILFVDPEKLKNGGRKSPKGVVAEDIYLKLEGKWTNIPTDQCQAESLGFTKQGCFLGMGKHYFYKMSKSLDCHDFQGIFLLYECGELVGLGLIPFGSFTSGPYRTWFEDPPVTAVKIIVPDRPKCLTEWVKKYGTSSIHIFFKPLPRLTSCFFPFQRWNQCASDSKYPFTKLKKKGSKKVDVTNGIVI